MADGDKRHLVEHHVPGKRLGRHLHHDPASRSFAAPVSGIQPATKVWHRHAQPWDQGALGACVGNAIGGLIMSDPVWFKGRRLGEAAAIRVYKRATQLDDLPGTYPPEDTGSTGLGGCKAAVSLKYATKYLWGFGIRDMIKILSGIGPVAVGTDWVSGFDDPDPSGLIRLQGSVRGGHEYQVLGYHHDQSLGAPISECFEIQNSWGADWGVKGTGGRGGRAFISVQDMAALLDHDGDVVTLATDSL